LFWGQITDFNIWNRPLSDVEIYDYSFNCTKEFAKKSKPEFLTWSNASILEIGKNTQHFAMSRSLLTCCKSRELKELQKKIIFENYYNTTYNDSWQFCQLLKGNLLLNPEKLKDHVGQIFQYWVPIVKSNYNNSTKWEYDQRVLNMSEEIPIPLIAGFGKETDLCMSYDIATNTYTPTDCYRRLPSICEVPAESLTFTVRTNSTSECTIEEKYNLFSENDTMYIAGFKGKLVIKRLHNTWSIYKYNFDLKEEKMIGTYLENRFFGTLIFDVIGVHEIECHNHGTNERGFLKLTNVSTQ
jgi:hypothetical protein